MPITPFILIHVFGAVVGLLSGYLAMFLRKGSGLHQAAGSIFFISMVGMTTSGAYVAIFERLNRMNVVAALLTFYLVVTAWSAARRREERTTLFDRAALLFGSMVALGGLTFGFMAASSPKGSLDHMPAAIYFIFGTVALLHAVSDVRMLVRGGVSGPRRIRRHLWRMCLALLIATLSFYPGQARFFSPALRESNLLLIPHVVLIGSMIFWMVRIRVRKRKASEAATTAVPSLQPHAPV